MSTMASQITSLTVVYSTFYSGTDQRKHQSSTSLAFVRGIHQSLVNSPHKGPVTRKMFPLDDVIMMAVSGVHQLLALFPSGWTERLKVVSHAGKSCFLTEISLSSIEWRAWIINYICILVWCVITHPYLNFNALS